MKKNIFTFISVFLALCFSSCGSEQQSEFRVDSTGVSPILLNLETDKIPPSYDKLYDEFKTETINNDFDGSYTILHFRKANKPIMDAYVYDDTIGSIEIFSSNIGSAEGISPGSKVQNLFDKKGKANISNDGQLSIVLGDLHYKVSGLKQAGDMKLQNAYATGENPLITAEDFESSAKVESIVVY